MQTDFNDEGGIEPFSMAASSVCSIFSRGVLRSEGLSRASSFLSAGRNWTASWAFNGSNKSFEAGTPRR